MPLVELENVSKRYRIGAVDVWALKDIDLHIEAGSFVAIVGPSGSGKTTLLNVIGCLDKPTEGRVRVAGSDVSTFDRTEAARFRGENIGFVFQDFNLMPVLTAAENVEYPLIMVQNRPAAERRERVPIFSKRSAWRTGPISSRTSSPAAKSSASPWPGRWFPGRSSCWPTNPPPTSTTTRRTPSSI
jgi:ABC-type lipoprotein export system ATPase subunit